MSDVLFERVALIGLGLEGSSLARVMKRDGMAGHIAGCARTRATIDKAMELGIVDSVHSRVGAADESRLVQVWDLVDGKPKTDPIFSSGFEIKFHIYPVKAKNLHHLSSLNNTTPYSSFIDHG